MTKPNPHAENNKNRQSDQGELRAFQRLSLMNVLVLT